MTSPRFPGFPESAVFLFSPAVVTVDKPVLRIYIKGEKISSGQGDVWGQLLRIPDRR